jgi:hypothetical protein
MHTRRTTAVLFLAVLLNAFCCAPARASSFQIFSAVYAQVASNLTALEHSADFSNPSNRHARAVLVAARDVIIDPDLTDERVLARLIEVFGAESAYTAWLDMAATNARAAVLGRYHALAERIELLPPSTRASRVQTRFAQMAGDLAALNGAVHAAEISARLAPFGNKVESVAKLVAAATVMPRPRVGANAVRATINGRRFSASGFGGHSPNIFLVTQPEPLYRSVHCRVVDVGQVLTISLPVVTAQPRYEVKSGLALVTHVMDIFSTNAATLAATNGTCWVQSTDGEVYGTFTCSGPGLEIKDGRFRVQVPRDRR